VNNNTDFSRVGYRDGHVPIPIVPARDTLEPSFDQEDDTARIQSAIDQVSGLPLESNDPRWCCLPRSCASESGSVPCRGSVGLTFFGRRFKRRGSRRIWNDHRCDGYNSERLCPRERDAHIRNG
jgi:hypothetical protein